MVVPPCHLLWPLRPSCCLLTCVPSSWPQEENKTEAVWSDTRLKVWESLSPLTVLSPLWRYQRGQGELVVDMYAQPPPKNTFLMGLTDPKDAWPLSDLLWDMRNVCSSLCALLCNSVRQFHFPYILINKAQLFTICQTNIPSICQIILISSSSLCHDVGAVFTPVLQSWKLKHWEVSTLESHENSIMNDEMYVLNNSVVIV